MPFKNKRCQQRNVKHGMFAGAKGYQRDKNKQYNEARWKLYGAEERQEESHSPSSCPSLSPAPSRCPSPAPSPFTASSPLESLPSTPPPVKRSSLRLNPLLQEPQMGRPTLYKAALTPDEHNERKRVLYEKKKKEKAVSAAR